MRPRLGQQEGGAQEGGEERAKAKKQAVALLLLLLWRVIRLPLLLRGQREGNSRREEAAILARAVGVPGQGRAGRTAKDRAWQHGQRQGWAARSILAAHACPSEALTQAHRLRGTEGVEDKGVSRRWRERHPSMTLLLLPYMHEQRPSSSSSGVTATSARRGSFRPASPARPSWAPTGCPTSTATKPGSPSGGRTSSC